jgi:hypothetical protein
VELPTDVAIKLTMLLFKGTNFLTSTGFSANFYFLANGFLTCVCLTFTFFGVWGATTMAAFFSG